MHSVKELERTLKLMENEVSESSSQFAGAVYNAMSVIDGYEERYLQTLWLQAGNLSNKIRQQPSKLEYSSSSEKILVQNEAVQAYNLAKTDPRSAWVGRIVTLNVSGAIFDTTCSTMQKERNSCLDRIIRGELEYEQDGDGNIFIQRDPQLFLSILDYLRYGVVPEFESYEELKLAFEEANAYGIVSLAERLSEMLIKRMRSLKSNISSERSVDGGEIEELSIPASRVTTPSVEAEKISELRQTCQAMNIFHNNQAAQDDMFQICDVGILWSVDSHDFKKAPLVIGLHPSSSAALSGEVQVGDQILSIDGNSLVHESISEHAIQCLMEGISGSMCVLEVATASDQKFVKQVCLKRQKYDDSMCKLRSIVERRSSGSNGSPLGVNNSNHFRSPSRDTVLAQSAEQGTSPPYSLNKQSLSPNRKQWSELDKAKDFSRDAEFRTLSRLLSRFYAVHSPNEIDRVIPIMSDYIRRGGGFFEFDVLNDSLRAKFGKDLGTYTDLIRSMQAAIASPNVIDAMDAVSVASFEYSSMFGGRETGSLYL